MQVKSTQTGSGSTPVIQEKKERPCIHGDCRQLGDKFSLGIDPCLAVTALVVAVVAASVAQRVFL